MYKILCKRMLSKTEPNILSPFKFGQAFQLLYLGPSIWRSPCGFATTTTVFFNFTNIIWIY